MTLQEQIMISQE